MCDDDWDINDATVVCRELRCGKAESVHGSAHFGQGSGQIWLDDVSCTGRDHPSHSAHTLLLEHITAAILKMQVLSVYKVKLMKTIGTPNNVTHTINR